MPSKLETLGARLDTVTRAAVGDTIIYTPAGATVPLTLLGLVEYPEEQFQTGNSAQVAQSITVELAIADVPMKPDPACRMTFPALNPGKFWSPVDARRSDAGDSWVMGVKSVR